MPHSHKIKIIMHQLYSLEPKVAFFEQFAKLMEITLKTAHSYGNAPIHMMSSVSLGVVYVCCSH